MFNSGGFTIWVLENKTAGGMPASDAQIEADDERSNTWCFKVASRGGRHRFQG